MVKVGEYGQGEGMWPRRGNVAKVRECGQGGEYGQGEGMWSR